MLFLMQDCSFDSLGISSVAVYLVDTGIKRSNVLAVFISLSGSKMRPRSAIGPELRTNEVRALQSSIRRESVVFLSKAFS